MSERRIAKLKDLLILCRKGITPCYSDTIADTICVLNQKCNRDYKICLDEARLHDRIKKHVPVELILRNHDILVNSTGKGTLGRVGQFKVQSFPVTVDSHMLILRPNEAVDPVFLGYYVKLFQDDLMNKGLGSSGQEELDKLSLLNISVNYPADAEKQRIIGELLNHIDEKISLNEQLNHNLAPRLAA